MANSTASTRSPPKIIAIRAVPSVPCSPPTKVRFLSIRRGSLDPTEREQIESHVVHSFHFLMQIPWTREIRNIPEIARAHHEKINGTGYPYRLKGEEIPVQARMMTICDMFDALSAADGPTRKPFPPRKPWPFWKIR